MSNPLQLLSLGLLSMVIVPGTEEDDTVELPAPPADPGPAIEMPGPSGLLPPAPPNRPPEPGVPMDLEPGIPIDIFDPPQRREIPLTFSICRVGPS